MIGKWKAIQDYGRCGHVGICGLNSREEAIAWLEKQWDWSRVYYLSPVWIVEQY